MSGKKKACIEALRADVANLECLLDERDIEIETLETAAEERELERQYAVGDLYSLINALIPVDQQWEGMTQEEVARYAGVAREAIRTIQGQIDDAWQSILRQMDLRKELADRTAFSVTVARTNTMLATDLEACMERLKRSKAEGESTVQAGLTVARILDDALTEIRRRKGNNALIARALAELKECLGPASGYDSTPRRIRAALDAISELVAEENPVGAKQG